MLARYHPSPRGRTSHKLRAGLAALGIGVLAALILAGLWLTLQKHARTQIDATSVNVINVAEAFTQNDLQTRLLELERLGGQWAADNGMQRSNWENVINTYLRDLPKFYSIDWTDSNLIVRWVFPVESNETIPGTDLKEIDAARRSILKARETGSAQYSFENTLSERGPAVVIYLPVEKNGEFDGVVSGALVLKPWLDGLFEKWGHTAHDIEVKLNGLSVYQSSETGRVDKQWSKQTQFETEDLNWVIEVSPRPEFVNSIKTQPSNLILGIGALLSLSLMTATFLAQLSSLKSREIKSYADLLESVFKDLPGMAFCHEVESPWRMDYVSHGCLAITGYSSEAFEQEDVLWADLIYPDDMKDVLERAENATLHGTMLHLDYRILSRNGKVRWLAESCKPILGPDGRPTHFEGFILDITKRKESEIALQQEQVYTEKVINSALEAILTMDTKCIIETSNDAASEMFGYERDEFKGMNLTDLLSPDFTGRHERNVAAFERTGKFLIIDEKISVDYKRKDGTLFSTEVSVNLIAHQGASKIVMDIRDMTKQRQAEREAQINREQLAHADRLNTLGEMATTIAHEVNQPLAAISLFAQAGKRFLEAGDVTSLPSIFDKLSLHSRRAGDIIKRVQNMTSRSQGIREIVRCNALMHEVQKLAESEALIYDVSINLDLENDLPELFVDPVQIQQVILNLLRNGLQAMDKVSFCNGREIVLRTRRSSEDELAIDIIDSGIGVGPEESQKLFEAFSTTSETGMGMGLWISQSIARSHGGRLSFENNSAHGTRFTLTLPVATQGDTNA